jgi:hypothetical protein
MIARTTHGAAMHRTGRKQGREAGTPLTGTGRSACTLDRVNSRANTDNS